MQLGEAITSSNNVILIVRLRNTDFEVAGIKDEVYVS